ncbi:MAG: flavodoxin [Bacteroidota bacterium]|nr:flavodoxin [Bacteroidota bacterium]
MKKTGIFYGGTESGNTKSVTDKLATFLKVPSKDVINIAEANIETLNKYDCLIFGTSSWGIGGAHYDWEDFVDLLGDLDYSNKKVALFGLGDQKKYPESFVDGMGMIYCRLNAKDNVVGYTSTEGYNYYFSMAEREGRFVGLAIDDDSQPELTVPRLKAWADQLKNEFQ